ncbi:MAG TPA: hypothetical protein PKD37_07605 [Oligoflexia bacterium]|nr:hypothetical protein [Oligoflexia bacterium]HMP27828.1 hypothetical protein [Oligoflexia bacterium]
MPFLCGVYKALRPSVSHYVVGLGGWQRRIVCVSSCIMDLFYHGYELLAAHSVNWRW